VDFQHETLLELGKGSKLRILHYDLHIRLAHFSIKPEQPNDQYVFPSRRKGLEGRPIVDVRKAVARAKKATDIEKRDNHSLVEALVRSSSA
jgi:integrase